jgi:3',5'-cyclic AMP phosphodiesterase CpdA
MKKNILFILAGFLFFISLSVFAQKTQSEYDRTIIDGLKKKKDALKFFVIGDWGRNGHLNQQQVADQMDIAAYHFGPDFFVSVGDNFYSDGVESIHDPMWQSSFEKVYHGGNLFEKWYIVLGNHDYRGNVQAQIDYTKISRRWNLPARYYDKQFDLDNGDKVHLIFIDTSPFEQEYYKTPEKYSDATKQDTTAQKKWLEKTLSESKAKWKIVVGHHPLYTTGKRFGKTESIIKAFHYVFEKHKVDVYFAGHEHDLQMQKLPNTHTLHVVSGAGSEVRPTGKQDYTLFAEAVPGFMAVGVTDKELSIQVVSMEGKVIFSYEIKK